MVLDIEKREQKKQFSYKDYFRTNNPKTHKTVIFKFKSHDCDDEDVDIEEEIDLYDPVSARDEELSGNALLWSSYIVQEVDMKESSM